MQAQQNAGIMSAFGQLGGAALSAPLTGGGSLFGLGMKKIGVG
jgi:hypothetical protein